MEIKDLIRKNIRELVPYSAARYEFSGKNAILLDANENPYRGTYNRYPDPWQLELKNALAYRMGISEEKIFIGNGADESIDLLIRAFCEPGSESILVNDPTYSMYQVSAQINGNHTIKAPLDPDFNLNLETVNKSIQPGTKLIFLCSPMNPSGNLLNKASIRSLLVSFRGLVIIDEAYIDFSGDEGFIPLIDKYPNLVVLQTLSKAWAMAGIRVGMAYANPEIIKVLNKIKPPYNVSGPSQKLALEVLANQNEFDQMVNQILEQREDLENFLSQYPLCTRVYPSDANFLLVRFKNAAHIFNYLREKSLIVRDRTKQKHCDNCLRITIGTKSEIEIFVDLLLKYEKEVTIN